MLISLYLKFTFREALVSMLKTPSSIIFVVLKLYYSYFRLLVHGTVRSISLQFLTTAQPQWEVVFSSSWGRFRELLILRVFVVSKGFKDPNEH